MHRMYKKGQKTNLLLDVIEFHKELKFARKLMIQSKPFFGDCKGKYDYIWCYNSNAWIQEWFLTIWFAFWTQIDILCNDLTTIFI